MTQEDKQLLLVDLCARLPYGVKVQYEDNVFDVDYISPMYEEIKLDIPDNYTLGISEVKPYLFPLSSMTEEQLYNNPVGFSQMLTIKADRNWENITINRRDYYKLVDWFNKNHFDYRNLIDKNLAIDCTNLNIY